MSEGLLPPAVQPYQGRPAGLITRSAAAAVDAVVVLALIMATYLAINGALFLFNPRRFHFVSMSSLVSRTGSLVVLAVYLAVAWSVSGRTYGCRLMGLRVVRARGGRVRLPIAVLRAVFCVLFPIGLLTCVVGRRRRSLADILLRTAVVYDWRAQPAREVTQPALSP